MSGCLIVSSLVLVTISWLSFSILHRHCQPTSKFLVLHTVPGLLLLVAGEAVDSLHQSVTSHCIHHLTTGVAIMILLPSTVNNFQGLTTSINIYTDSHILSSQKGPEARGQHFSPSREK